MSNGKNLHSKRSPRMDNVKYYQRVGHVDHSQPEDHPCNSLPVETNLKLETDQTTTLRISGQGAALVTDVLQTRAGSLCWNLSELQHRKWSLIWRIGGEWLNEVAKIDLLEHYQKRDLLITTLATHAQTLIGLQPSPQPSYKPMTLLVPTWNNCLCHGCSSKSLCRLLLLQSQAIACQIGMFGMQERNCMF